MKDSQGEILECGQRVVVLYTVPPCPTFRISRVVGFTPKNVRVANPFFDPGNGLRESFLAKPDWVTVIPEEGG